LTDQAREFDFVSVRSIKEPFLVSAAEGVTRRATQRRFQELPADGAGRR
jgi:hypothetical protein